MSRAPRSRNGLPRRSQSGSSPPYPFFFTPRLLLLVLCGHSVYLGSVDSNCDTRPGFPALGSSAVCRPGRSSETAGPPVALPAPARGFRAGVLSLLSTLLQRRSVSLLLPRGLLPFPLPPPPPPPPTPSSTPALRASFRVAQLHRRCTPAPNFSSRSSRLLRFSRLRLLRFLSSSCRSPYFRSCVLYDDKTRDHCSSRKRGQISRSLHDVILSLSLFPLCISSLGIEWRAGLDLRARVLSSASSREKL